MRACSGRSKSQGYLLFEQSCTPTSYSVFTGFEVEDPTVGYLFVGQSLALQFDIANLNVIIIAPVWEKLEHHEKLMQDSSYPTILSTLAAAQSGPPLSMLHFDMTDDP